MSLDEPNSSFISAHKEFEKSIPAKLLSPIQLPLTWQSVTSAFEIRSEFSKAVEVVTC